MSDVFPGRDGHPAWGIGGPKAVTGAWGGGAFDTTRNRLIVTGGGHADYGGNEVYEFDLSAAKWKRTTDPSRMRDIGGGAFAVEQGEAPVSSHTYGGLVYLPNVDRMLKFGGGYYRNGTSYDKHVYLYDIERRTWSRRAEAPHRVPTPIVDYDGKTGRVLVVSSRALMSYDPVADTWKTLVDREPDVAIYAGAFDPETRRFVMIARLGEMRFYDVDAPGPRQKAALTGQADWGSRVGVAHDPQTRQFVLWAGDREVWTVNPRTWDVCKIADATGPAPTATTSQGQQKSQGIYGRWRHVPTLNAFIGYNSSSDNVWLYRLPSHPDADRPRPARPLGDK